MKQNDQVGNVEATLELALSLFVCLSLFLGIRINVSF